MKKQLSLIVASTLMLAACEQASDTNQDATSTAEEALMEHIKVLSSDEFGGRGPDSAGEELSVQYLTSFFKQHGLKPGNGDSYVQTVPLISIETNPSASFVIMDSEGTARTLSYGDEMVIGTRQMKDTVGFDASDMVFVGYGINAPERGRNDYEGLDVKGKTVVMMINDPGFATQDPNIFEGNAMTYYGRWTYKYDEAARQGAAGVIIIHETKPASYPWEVVRNGWSGKQFGIERADGGASLSKIEGWISRDVAEELFTTAGLDYEAMKVAAKTQGFKAVPMGLQASTSIENTIERTQSRNVVAVIEGTESPDEFFIYMAHYDHLGIDPDIEGDNIYNGALDNASGTAALMEIAKRFSEGGEAPERSIMFLAVGAEEQGLLGSAYYGANPLVPLNKTVAGLNMDGMNTFGLTNDLVIVGRGNSDLDVYMEEIVASYGRVVAPDPNAEKGYFYRSDHFSLAKYGVPMLYPDNGIDHVEKGAAYGLQKAAEYTANDYHKPSDEIKDDWVLDGAIADMNLYYDLGYKIANSDLWPEWTEQSGFKAIREASLKGN